MILLKIAELFRLLLVEDKRVMKDLLCYTNVYSEIK